MESNEHRNLQCPRCPNVPTEIEVRFQQEIYEVIEETQKELLDKGENIIPWAAFNSFRKMVLDSFGNKGIRAKLHRIFENQNEDLNRRNK